MTESDEGGHQRAALNKAGVGDYLRALPQYLLPQHLLSRLVHAATRSRRPWLRNPLMKHFLARFPVRLEEAVESDPGRYESFNDFFTRPLREGVRPLARARLLSPVDGRVSQLGRIEAGRIFQAKGRDYGLAELLGEDAPMDALTGGRFFTLYLAPHNYHRIHMPVDGELRGLQHLPGRLFSVNPATTRVIPRLFARNERVCAHFETEYGPMAVVMVGALLVGSIETPWHGEITPPTRLSPRRLPLPPAGRRQIRAGEEIGRFNMGSTVILLLPEQAPAPGRWLHPGAEVRVGQALSED